MQNFVRGPLGPPFPVQLHVWLISCNLLFHIAFAFLYVKGVNLVQGGQFNSGLYTVTVWQAGMASWQPTFRKSNYLTQTRLVVK